jgi:hypothetical protein
MQADGGEVDPEEFKEFTDQELQSKVTRLRALRSRTADGGEKVGRMIYRVEKELDRRRAAGPTKVSEIWVLRNPFRGHVLQTAQGTGCFPYSCMQRLSVVGLGSGKLWSRWSVSWFSFSIWFSGFNLGFGARFWAKQRIFSCFQLL